MDDGSMTLWVALVVLVALSAFFSASETAFSSLNQIRLKSRAEDGDNSAARVLAMAEKYDKLLSTILIGNNIVNIAAASIGTIIFTKMLGAERGATVSTMVLTVVVLIFAWAIVLGKKEGGDWKKMTRRDAVLLVLSGITTGASWLCYYRALQTGRASVVVPIDKCSMLFAVALSAIFLKEKQTRRSLLALALVVAGTFMIALA